MQLEAVNRSTDVDKGPNNQNVSGGMAYNVTLTADNELVYIIVSRLTCVGWFILFARRLLVDNIAPGPESSQYVPDNAHRGSLVPRQRQR